MFACFAMIASVASTIREFINCIRALVKRHLIFKKKKITKTCRGLKNNLDLTKRKVFVTFVNFFVNVFFIAIARDKLPRYGRAINNSFFFFFFANMGQ